MAKRTILTLIIVAILGAAVAVPARSSRAEAAADDCLSEPNGAPPQGSHWYYRTDRSTSRRCWYLGPQREKVKEVRDVAPPKPRPSSRPISELKAEPPAEPIARTAEPVPDVPMQLQSLPTSAAPIEPESAPASDRGADEQLETRPQREEGEQVDKPLIRPVPTATDLAAGATSNIRLEHMLALVAAALALAAVIVRKVFKLFVVRRLRRRRSALRSQWEAASATRAPVSSAFANMVAAVRHADVVHDPVAATRSADIARKPAGRRDPSHDIAGIEDRCIEESWRRLLHDLRRAAA
jgi:hypothetical protein